MTTPPSDPTPPGPELPTPPSASPSAPVPPPNPWATYGGTPQQYAAAPQPRVGAFDYRAPASKTMAGWALGLAIVPCCFGITTLVGIGLAITVLVKSRHGENHGKGLAIAALIIAPLWIVGFFVAGFVGAFQDLTRDADRDASGAVTARDDMSASKIRAGDCFDYPELFGYNGDEDVAAGFVSVTPCTEPHQFEAFKVFDLPDGSYPGNDRASTLAAEGCLPAFRGFVGKSYGRSKLESYLIYPQSGSWRLLDDHKVTCMVGDPGELTTGTLEHSRR